MPRGAEHRALLGLDHLARVLLQRVAEGVVGGDEVPALLAFLDQRPRGAGGQRIGVGRPLRRQRRALLAEDGGGQARRRHHHAVLLLGNLHHCERGGGRGEVGHHVDLALVEPAARQVGGHVRLVLVIGEHQLDRLAEHLAAHLLDREARGRDGALAGQVGIDARQVVEHADLDDVVTDLGQGRKRGTGREAENESHGSKNGPKPPRRPPCR